jgi:UDP-glucuronate decarboxylase
LAETICADFQRLGRVDARLVRIFNTYGPNMRLDDGRVVTNFLLQALRGEALTVYGDGSQTRSFCYVDDLIEGFVRVLAAPTNLGPVNLGNPQEFTMLELAQAVQAEVGMVTPIQYRPLPVDDPKQRCPDIAKARAHLQWQPTVELAEGLRRTTAYLSPLSQR